MKATRRDALLGALAVPVLSVAERRARGEALVVYDPTLADGRRLAEAGPALAIAGDRIRFARAVFALRPSLIVGVSRAADTLLIEDVGHEAGYRRVAAPASAGGSAWALAPRV